MLEKLQGVIIRTQDYKETHKIITLFSDKLGKITALARGAKKPKSRMAAATQPFIYGEYLVYINKGKGLGTIQQASIVHSMRQIREDIEKNAYASYVLEITDKIAENKQPLPYIYNELFHTLKWIAEHDEYIIPAMMYELKMYEVGGFAPILNRCAQCNSTQLPYYFSVNEGGVLCSQCSQIDPQSIMLQGKLAHIFHAFQQVSIEKIGNVSLKQSNKDLFRMLLDSYYDSYGSYPIKTKRFIRQLDELKGE